MGKLTGKVYRPSNGTEGDWFCSKFCENCIHEKFTHTQRHGDKQCDLMSAAFFFDDKDKEYPREWTYDEYDKPTCTKWQYWKWRNDDDDDDGLNEPPPDFPDDPAQLCLPFILDEIELNTSKLGKKVLPKGWEGPVPILKPH